MSASDESWHPSPTDVRLAENEVHVWRASLNVPASMLQHLQQLLTLAEVAQAERFYFEKDRHHFIVARGVLRTILSRYLNGDPRQLRFCYNPYGKPSLDVPFSASK